MKHSTIKAINGQEISIDMYSIAGDTAARFVVDEHGCYNVINVDGTYYSEELILKALDTHKKHFPEDFI
jgi:hypothetical protein